MRHTLTALITALALATTACGALGLQNEVPASPHMPAVSAYDFWVDPDVSPQSVTAVQGAVTQWTSYTDVKITLHYGAHVCLLDCLSIHEVPQAQLDQYTDGDYVGYTIPGFLFIAAGRTAAQVNETAIHEMGHAIGLVHVPSTDFAVMTATSGTGSLHVACDDVHQFYTVRSRATPTTVTPCSDATGP
jgi:hypothetical protein